MARARDARSRRRSDRAASRELEQEVPISSGDDTQVVAKLPAGTLSRCREEVAVCPKYRPWCCQVVLYRLCGGGFVR